MKTNIKDKLLSKEQIEVVKEMIVESMKGVYTDKGEQPGDPFYRAAGVVADKIIKNVQMAIIQENTFKKTVKKPLKASKASKKVVKKVIKKRK
jgi:hypothetical protein